MFCITFYVGSGIGFHYRYGSGSAKAKSCGSFGSDSGSGSSKLHITWYVVLQSLKTSTGKKSGKPLMKLEIHINATRARKYRYCLLKRNILEKKTVCAPDLSICDF